MQMLKCKCSNANANAQMQMLKCKCKCKCSNTTVQIQMLKFSKANTNAQMFINSGINSPAFKYDGKVKTTSVYSSCDFKPHIIRWEKLCVYILLLCQKHLQTHQTHTCMFMTCMCIHTLSLYIFILRDDSKINSLVCECIRS